MLESRFQNHTELNWQPLRGMKSSRVFNAVYGIALRNTIMLTVLFELQQNTPNFA